MIAVVDNPTVVWHPILEKTQWISAYTLYFQQIKLLVYIFAVDSMGLSIFIQIFMVGSVRRIFSVSAVQGSPRSFILVRIESAYATSY